MMPTTRAAALATSRTDQGSAHAFEVAFLPADSCVRHMRRITTAHLRHWNLDLLIDTGTLVVSELVTNAVQHGQGSPVGLRVTRSTGEVRIEVMDGTRAPAQLRSADETDETGRGLALVAALAQDWGVSPDGTVTWCSLAIPSRGS